MLAIHNPLFEAFFTPYENEPRARLENWAWNRFSPAADVRETDQGYLLELDVPGLTQKDVELVLENQHLTLRGERKLAEDANFSRRERSFGAFERAFHLPDDVDTGRVEARVQNGVLTVTIPKRESAKPRSIAIQTS